MTNQLEEFKPWLTKTSRALCRVVSDIDWEDLAQEGWIAMWKADQSYDGRGNRDMWLKANARWRMKTVLRKRENNMPVDFNTPFNNNDDDTIWYVDAGVWLDDVATAYHEGEIMAAIDRLPEKQRKYVMLRFYCGYQHQQLTKEFGYNPGTFWSSKINGARWKLAEELNHLKELVPA